MLKIRGLSKTYENGVKALDNIELEIPMGMFGLLGPNGAGKSSLMRTLATLQEADTGSAFFNDIDIFKNKMKMRSMLGYLPQEFGVYPGISAKRLLSHIADMKGVINKDEQIEALLYKVNLQRHAKMNVNSFSGGMRQRFGIAQALLGNPKLLIVDEPTAGLDPAERNRFHNLLAEIGEDTVVILSTHIVEDIKNLCPRMAIINSGQIVSRGNTREIIKSFNDKIWTKIISRGELERLSEEYMVLSTTVYEGKMVANIYNEVRPDKEFLEKAPDLEDVYFHTIFSKEGS